MGGLPVGVRPSPGVPVVTRPGMQTGGSLHGSPYVPCVCIHRLIKARRRVQAGPETLLLSPGPKGRGHFWHLEPAAPSGLSPGAAPAPPPVSCWVQGEGAPAPPLPTPQRQLALRAPATPPPVRARQPFPPPPLPQPHLQCTLHLLAPGKTSEGLSFGSIEDPLGNGARRCPGTEGLRGERRCGGDPKFCTGALLRRPPSPREGHAPHSPWSLQAKITASFSGYAPRRGLSSPLRDGTRAPALVARSRNHWTARES